MGYTHYWTQRRAFTADEWTQVTDDLRALVKHMQHEEGIPLADAMGDGGTSPAFGATGIAFNGLGDDAHETFSVYRNRVKEWEGGRLGGSFTKTARKPYDLAVTAALCYLATVMETHDVSSDGNGSEWLPGLAAARRALPRYANVLDIPRPILEDDRWCGPWISHHTTAYQFRFCIDGRAYVIRSKDGATYCFPDHQEAAAFGQKHREVFNATGYFDQVRRDRLKRAQDRILGELVRYADIFGRTQKPPAFARPNEFPPPPSGRAHYFADVLNAANAAA